MTADLEELLEEARNRSHPERVSRRYCLVGSSGGHLMQLLSTSELWRTSDRSWVTFKKPDAESLLVGERVYWCHHPTNRNVFNLLRNLWLALSVLRYERPDVIVSTGAGAAIPYFLIGRLFGSILVYIEVYDRVDSPTITGRICHKLAHVFALQWPEQQRHYRRGNFIGPLV